jgi:hypothetical protein
VHDKSLHHARTLPRDVAWRQRARAKRLSKDAAVIAEDYPEFKFTRDAATGEPQLKGEISIPSESGITERIPVRIDFPESYPTKEPAPYDYSDRFEHTQDGHFYQDGRCCLWMGWASEWNGHEPLGLLRFLDQLVVFFDRQLAYEANGRKRWPGPAWEHGSYGYLQMLREELRVVPEVFDGLLPAFENYRGFPKYAPCPCGSGKQFRWCHDKSVLEIIRKVGKHTLHERLAALHTSATAGVKR